MRIKKDIIAVRVDGGTKAKVEAICYNSGITRSKLVQTLLQELDINTIIKV